MVIDNTVQPNEDLITLEYINALYSIEMLRQADPRVVNEFTAWQFGQMSDAIWKNHPQSTHQFYMLHRHELERFNVHKIRCMMNKLAAGLDKFGSFLYATTAVEPELFNSITALLRSALGSKHGYEFGVHDASIAHSTQNFGGLKNSDFDIHLADRLLQNEFNMFTEDRVDLDTDSSKKRYGQNRHTLLDNKVMFDWNAIKKLCTDAISKGYTPGGRTDIIDKRIAPSKNTLFFASLFSVLYHLRVPTLIHPNTLDRMYDKYILTNDLASDGLQFARKYSGFQSMDVIACRLLPMNSKLTVQSWMPHNFVVGTCAPNSTVERYLVTQYILENRCGKTEF